MSLITKVLVLVAVLAAAIVGVVFWLRPVAQIAPVIVGKAIQSVPASVTVQPENRLPVVSEVGGRILTENYNLDPGLSVRAGEVLAQLDTQTLELEIKQTEINLEAAKRAREIGIPQRRDLEGEKAILQRFERELELRNMSEVDVNKQRLIVQRIETEIALLESAEQQLIQSYDNTLSRQKRQQQAMTIKAPIAGQISEVFVNQGQFIGDRHILATLITNTRTVEAKVSEENFADIEIGKPATVRFLSYGDQKFEAKVSKILPTADPETQRYILHLDVDIDPKLLKPGITGEAAIIIGERDNTLIIPRRAMMGNSVLVVENGRVAVRAVKPGYTSWNVVEILEGLSEGELVIVEQVDQFRPGDRVSTTAAPEL